VNLRLTHTEPRIQSKYRRRGSPPRVSASHFEVRTTTSVNRGANSQTNTCHTLVLVCRRQRTRGRARAHTRTPSHKQTPTRNRVLIQSTVEIVVGVTVKSHSRCENRAARPRQKLHKHLDRTKAKASPLTFTTRTPQHTLPHAVQSQRALIISTCNYPTRFTYSHIHTFTHSHIHTHTHTNTHSHRDYSDYSDSSFDRKKGRVRDRGLAHKSDFRYADHAYSRNQSQSTRCVFAKTSRRHFHTQTPVLAPASKLQQTKVGRTNANAKPYITTYFPTHSTFTTRIHVYNIQLPHPVQNVRQTHMLAPTISGSSSI